MPSLVGSEMCIRDRSRRSLTTRASIQARDRVRTFMRSRSDMVSGVLRGLRFGRSPCNLYQIRAAIILRYAVLIFFLNSQPQTHHSRKKGRKNENIRPACHGLGTHGGGWGKKQQDQRDKSGALQGETVRVRASRSWARPAPRSELFYLIGRAPNRPL